VLVHLKEVKEKKKVRVEKFSSCYLGFGFCKIASTNIQIFEYLFFVVRFFLNVNRCNVYQTNKFIYHKKVATEL
jgi:hypothetical protein